MTGSASRAITTGRFDAVVLDMDGVITDTAIVHAEAWRTIFDALLSERTAQGRPACAPFDPVGDYAALIDGKGRLDGVRSFLASRSIDLPEGAPDDAPSGRSVHAIGNAKNDAFLRALREHGPRVFEDTLERVRAWRDAGLRTAVVSSSRNCREVIERAGVTGLFDARIDGVTLMERGLRGKPAPDLFVEAARALGVDPARCVAIEDAISGVASARGAGCGLVIGVDRLGHAEALRAHGAHEVVRTVGDLARP